MVEVARPEESVRNEVTYPNISDKGTKAFTTLDPAAIVHGMLLDHDVC